MYEVYWQNDDKIWMLIFSTSYYSVWIKTKIITESKKSLIIHFCEMFGGPLDILGPQAIACVCLMVATPLCLVDKSYRYRFNFIISRPISFPCMPVLHMPVHACAAQACSLKRLKNDLRTTMTAERLNSIAVLHTHTHTEKSEKLNLKEVGHIFV